MLTGIVTYRFLSRVEKSEVMESLYQPLVLQSAPASIKRVMSNLYGLPGNIVANPYWYTWSLSDQELRDYYETNLQLSRAIEYLGLDFGSSLSVAGLASGMVAVAKAGLRNSVLDTVQTKTNHELGKRVGSMLGMGAHGARSLGVQAAMVTIFAGILHAQFTNSSDQAKRELLARGLLLFEEI